MSYKEKLNEIIVQSGLTLGQIEAKCKSYGENITVSYLSKLRSGKNDPASDSKNIAIARACGADPDELIFEAYLDKAPGSIIKFISNFANSVRTMLEPYLKSVANDEQYNAAMQQIAELTNYKIIKEYNEHPNDATNLFVDKKSGDIPIKFKSFYMNDDSMQPIISQNDIIHIDVDKQYRVGDIVLCKIKNGSNLIKRYFEKDDKILLISDNRNYEPIELSIDGYEFIYRVKSITKEI